MNKLVALLIKLKQKLKSLLVKLGLVEPEKEVVLNLNEEDVNRMKTSLYDDYAVGYAEDEEGNVEDVSYDEVKCGDCVVDEFVEEKKKPKKPKKSSKSKKKKKSKKK